jgi:hypothetical protein
MVLYAKTLRASATVLGIIAGMMPLLVIFQIPAANYIPIHQLFRRSRLSLTHSVAESDSPPAMP